MRGSSPRMTKQESPVMTRQILASEDIVRARGGEKFHGLASLLARAVARALAAAKGHMIVDAGCRQIDHDHSRLAMFAEMGGVFQRGGENARREAEAGII